MLVLDGGMVAEFDTPSVLVKQERSIFREMVSKSGTTAALEEKLVDM